MVTLAEQLRRMFAGAHDNGGDKESFMAVHAYRYWRGYGEDDVIPLPARRALDLAKCDAAASVSRLPFDHRNNMGAPTSDGLRWVEYPARVGLRFVGFADNIVSRIDHKGWFADGLESCTYRGAVYQFPARDGRPVYVAGYRAGAYDYQARAWRDFDGASARLNLQSLYLGDVGGSDAEISFGACQAAMASDRMAAGAAEADREYSECWSEGNRYADLGEEMADARESALSLIKGIRAMRESAMVQAPDIIAALLGELKRQRASIAKARAKRTALLEDNEHMRGTWRDNLWQAFAEGAGLQG